MSDIKNISISINYSDSANDDEIKLKVNSKRTEKGMKSYIPV